MAIEWKIIHPPFSPLDFLFSSLDLYLISSLIQVTPYLLLRWLNSLFWHKCYLLTGFIKDIPVLNVSTDVKKKQGVMKKHFQNLQLNDKNLHEQVKLTIREVWEN